MKASDRIQKEDLAELLKRVEAAEGPRKWDDPLNADLHLALGWTRELDHEVYGGKHAPPWEWTDPDGHYCAHHIEDATRSLDAALALCERVLPGWELELTSELRDDAMIWRVVLGDPLRGTDGEAPTPALALLAAMLRALQALSGGGGGDNNSAQRGADDMSAGRASIE